jgi:PBSX family phage portal protein
MAGKKSPPVDVKKALPKGPVVKAQIVAVPAAQSPLDLAHDAMGNVKHVKGLLDPPYEPSKLVWLHDISSVLSQHVEAIATNVDSHGHKYVPTIDLTSADALDRVKAALVNEQMELDDRGETTFKEPTEAEIKAKFDLVKRRSEFELNRLRTFFASCCPDFSFIELRMRMRRDQRITGNGYWEVLRDQKNRPARLVFVSTVNMRLGPKDPHPVKIEEAVPVSDLSTAPVTQLRFFRRYAEVNPKSLQVLAYFKEFGDPRVVSRKTGQAYNTMPEFLATDGAKKKEDVPATEIIHFDVANPASPYGRPEWIGNLPAVLGSRELDEVNLSYFENKTVPPLALLVNGGRLSRGVIPRIEEFIEHQVKGKRNFHKILIIEAEGQRTAGGTSGIVPAMKFVPLREAQQQDAQFQDYDEKNWDKIASSFRLPRILTGRDRAINRATALAALRFAEEQVFEPIRNQFDEFMNRRLLPELGVFLWKFKSNTPITRDPEMVAEIIAVLSDAGAITPAEARVFASDVFNRELDVRIEPWTTKPFKLALALAKAGGLGTAEPAGTAGQAAAAEPEPDPGERTAGGGADRIRAIRTRMEAEAAASVTPISKAKGETKPEPTPEDGVGLRETTAL